jgi:hypothetical protein
MPNGKGTLGCTYCRHFAGARCTFHGVPIPPDAGGWNTICISFDPSQLYWEHNAPYSPPARRFAWFGCDLEAGVLYRFPDGVPKLIERVSVMRVPDLVGGWRSPP